MSKKEDHEQFFWKHWRDGKLPDLEDHSQKKLDLLHDYLVRYLEIVLTGTTGKDEQFVTLVDGFAGGGIYADKKIGSPLTILKAVEEAEARVNQNRDKRTRITPICWFIEKDKDAFDCLEVTLRAAGYGDRIGKTIHLHREEFQVIAPTIVADINGRHTRGGNRTIFFLDQCGWAEISAKTIKDLAAQLHGRAEFLVNFAVTWLSDFISAKTLEAKTKSLENLGLGGQVDLNAMMKLRTDLGGNWEHAVEAHIGAGFHLATEIPYYSPFYICPENNHRGYLLIHLAGSARARSAMTEIHWRTANRSRHFGYAGFDMLCYRPDREAGDFIKGISFDDESRAACENVLANDLARLLSAEYREGIPYGVFLDKITNKIMASAPMVKEVVWRLGETNDFEIQSPSGQPKRTENLALEDIIMPRRQPYFLPLAVPQRPAPKRAAPSKPTLRTGSL